MKRTIQEIMHEMNDKLTEATRCLAEGLVCPRESMNYIIDVVCRANEEIESSTCSQDWKPCLLECDVKCSCKDHALETDVIGKCEKCHKDVLKSETAFTKGTFSLIHITCQ